MTEKKNKLKELRQLGPQELKEKLQQARNEILSEKGASASGTKTSGKIRQMKKLVARILTILNEKESSPKDKGEVKQK